MKPILVSAAAAALAVAFAGPALANPGPEVEIEHAVARVVVIVEDRTDIGVEIEQGSSELPALRVERDGAAERLGDARDPHVVAGARLPPPRHVPAPDPDHRRASAAVKGRDRTRWPTFRRDEAFEPATDLDRARAGLRRGGDRQQGEQGGEAGESM